MKKKRIENRVNQREQEIRDTLTEIIDTIEKYFTVAPFQWIRGESEETGCYCFSDDAKTPFYRFDRWFDNWLCKLYPEAYEAQRVLDEQRTDGGEAGELAFAAQKLGFLCGVLVGSKSRGATRDELLKQCDGYILPTMKWERQRITEDAEKQGKEQRP